MIIVATIYKKRKRYAMTFWIYAEAVHSVIIGGSKRSFNRSIQAFNQHSPSLLQYGDVGEGLGSNIKALEISKKLENVITESKTRIKILFILEKLRLKFGSL